MDMLNPINDKLRKMASRSKSQNKLTKQPKFL